MSPVLQKIGDYVLSNPSKVVYQTITEVADGSASSEASVLRFCRDLGYSSFQRFKLTLGIEVSGEGTVTAVGPTGDAVEDIVNTAIGALQQTKDLLDRATLRTIVSKLIKARAIDLYALGGSANVARYAHYRFVRLGLKSRMFDDPHLGIMSAVELGAKDVAIGISEMGSSKDTVHNLQLARKSGAFTVAITNHMRSPIARTANAVLTASSTETPLTGGEIPTVVGQVMIIDVVAALIAKVDHKYVEANQRTAEAGIDASF